MVNDIILHFMAFYVFISQVAGKEFTLKYSNNILLIHIHKYT